MNVLLFFRQYTTPLDNKDETRPDKVQTRGCRCRKRGYGEGGISFATVPAPGLAPSLDTTDEFVSSRLVGEGFAAMKSA
jgi:hypothetical protein